MSIFSSASSHRTHAWRSGIGLVIAFVRAIGVNLPRQSHLSLHQPHALSWPPLPTIAFSSDPFQLGQLLRPETERFVVLETQVRR